MSDYFAAAMRLYLDRLVDWETQLCLRRGDPLSLDADRALLQDLAFRVAIRKT